MWCLCFQSVWPELFHKASCLLDFETLMAHKLIKWTCKFLIKGTQLIFCCIIYDDVLLLIKCNNSNECSPQAWANSVLSNCSDLSNSGCFVYTPHVSLCLPKKKQNLIFHRFFFPKCFELHITSKVGRSSPGEGRDEYSLQSEELRVVDVHHTQLHIPNLLVQERGRSYISCLWGPWI